MLLFRATKEESRIQQAVSAAENAERLNPDLPAGAERAWHGVREHGPQCRSDRQVQAGARAGAELGRGAIAAGTVAGTPRAGWRNRSPCSRRRSASTPTTGATTIGLANAYRKAGDHENEIREFQEVVRLKPDTGNNNLGAAYFAADGGKRRSRRFRRRSRSIPSMNYNLGVAQFYLGKYAGSRPGIRSGPGQRPGSRQRRPVARRYLPLVGPAGEGGRDVRPGAGVGFEGAEGQAERRRGPQHPGGVRRAEEPARGSAPVHPGCPDHRQRKHRLHVPGGAGIRHRAATGPRRWRAPAGAARTATPSASPKPSPS